MKANSKRKVFGDAVDLLMGDIEEVTMQRGVEMVPVKSIQPFHDHPFHLYEGERLEDMIAGVKEHGVLNPVIVQKLDTGYEMLSGHNRWNAAKLAGIKEIPAIVKTDLSEEEAYVYVIETNLMQRSFSDLAISEKAAVLKARYEKEACQGKRNDILEEIARMEGKEVPVTYGHGDQRLNTRDMIGKEYELSGSSVGRLLKLNDLIKPFKDMVDRGALYTKVALQLAFLPENEQAMVYEIMKEKKTKITIEMVMKLRSHSGALTEANGAVYSDDGDELVIHDQKLDALEDMIEAANGRPVMVAYWFKHDLSRIMRRLTEKKIPFEKLDSEESIRKWNRGELPVALIHPASAGHGLNLQSGGNTLIWFGLTWSLELYQQTVARLWRQGQTAETVVVQHIITAGTIDEDVMKALANKDMIQNRLIAAVKARVTHGR